MGGIHLHQYETCCEFILWEGNYPPPPTPPHPWLICPVSHFFMHFIFNNWYLYCHVWLSSNLIWDSFWGTQPVACCLTSSLCFSQWKRDLYRTITGTFQGLVSQSYISIDLRPAYLIQQYPLLVYCNSWVVYGCCVISAILSVYCNRCIRLSLLPRLYIWSGFY